MVGNLRTLADRDLREFKDQLSIMLIGLLFVMLAADVRYEQVLALGWPGLMVVGASTSNKGNSVPESTR